MYGTPPRPDPIGPGTGNLRALGHYPRKAEDRAAALALQPSAADLLDALDVECRSYDDAASSLTAGEPEGADWRAAEARDAEAALAGEPPNSLARLITDWPQRYATCLALLHTERARLSRVLDQHAEDLAALADAAEGRATEMAADYRRSITDAWTLRHTSSAKARAAWDAAESISAELATVQALGRWARRETVEYDPSGAAAVNLSDEEQGVLAAAHEHHTGQPSAALWQGTVVPPADYEPPESQAGYFALFGDFMSGTE